MLTRLQGVAVVVCSLVACKSVDHGAGNPDAGSASNPDPDASVGDDDFLVAVDAALVRVVQGQTAGVGVAVTRHGFTGPVTVAVAGLPGGVTAEPLVVEADAGTLVLHADPGAAQGDATVTVTATGGEHSHSVVLPLLAMGRPGTPDQTFASAGILNTFPGKSETVVIQPDGKLVFAGVAVAGDSNFHLIVTRYLRDGTLDTSFSGGMVLIDASIGFYRSALVLQEDEKIVVVTQRGHRSTLGVVVRLNPDGTRDAGFGTDGEVVLDLSDPGTGVAPSTALTAAVIQPDGRIVVAGDAVILEGEIAFRRAVLARLTTSGALDASFGAAGRAATALGAETASVLAIALQPDGRIVAVGASGEAGSLTRFAAFARFDSAGALDTSFGRDGVVPTGLTFNPDRAAVATQPDGKVVAAGGIVTPEGQNACLIRLSGSDGSLDPGFGDAGVKVLDLAADRDDAATGVALQPDGKLVIAGSADDDHGRHGFVARLTSEAVLDDSFAGGIVSVAAPRAEDSVEFQTVALAPDGRILAGGFVFFSQLELIATRLWP